MRSNLERGLNGTLRVNEDEWRLTLSLELKKAFFFWLVLEIYRRILNVELVLGKFTEATININL